MARMGSGALVAAALATAGGTMGRAALPEQPAPAAPLQHSSKWKVGGEDNVCSLQRDYGPPDAPTTLTFQLVGGNVDTRLSVQVLEPGDAYIDRVDAGSLVLGPDGRSIPVKVRSFGPVTTSRRAGSRRQTGMAVEGASVRDIILAPTLTVMRDKAGPPVVIAPGGSPEAADALDRCEDQRLTSLGIDAAAQHRLSRRPEPVGGSAAKWFKPSDYPKAARSMARSGRTVALVTVAADGTVSDCLTQTSAGNPDLDATTCTLLRARGRYVPALDRAGQPVAAQTLVSVRWFWFKR